MPQRLYFVTARRVDTGLVHTSRSASKCSGVRGLAGPRNLGPVLPERHRVLVREAQELHARVARRSRVRGGIRARRLVHEERKAEATPEASATSEDASI